MMMMEKVWRSYIRGAKSPEWLKASPELLQSWLLIDAKDGDVSPETVAKVEQKLVLELLKPQEQTQQ